VARECWARGYAVICPHLNTIDFDNVLTREEFIERDLEIVAKCDAVLMLPNWEISEGAKEEKALAESLDIPVTIYPLLP